MKKGFSIVVCAYNAAERIVTTLKALSHLILPEAFKVELILVDNNSTDQTCQIATEAWKEFNAPYELRLFHEFKAGKAHAVEKGYDAARYSYIVTVDDDNWLDKTYLVTAKELFDSDQTIGVLQGNSTGVFEKEPQSWIKQDNLEHFFVIGGPIKEPGYYPPNNFGAWGAGMVIKKEDWLYLRDLGFSFLTCKLPGKAAGEDHELAIGLLLMGRRIYYSDKLRFQHYMPAERVTWDKLKQNFETFGYATHYNFLYALVLDAHKNGYTLTNDLIRKKFFRFWLRFMRNYSWKQHLSYWLRPQQQYYQLRMLQHYAQYRWFKKLLKRVVADVQFLQSWMLPLLKQYQVEFSMNHLFHI